MKFEIEETDEFFTSRAGLALIGQLLGKTDLMKRLDAIKLDASKRPDITHGENAISMIALLAMGKPDFDAIEEFRKDDFFRNALNLNTVPSEGTLRQRLEMLGSEFNPIIFEESAKLLKKIGVDLTPCHGKYLPLDIDVSPFDNSGSKKEGISWTYKDFIGYSPVFAYLGEEGYLVNALLKEGKDHCQKGMPDFLSSTIDYIRMITNALILARLDSGNDSLDNIVVCMAKRIDWLIKRNLRKEEPDEWLFEAITNGEKSKPRTGKTVWVGETFLDVKGFDKPLRVVYEVTKRDIDKHGQMLLIPEVEVNTWWTSLPDKPQTIIDLYHKHGTSEQFHSEIKSDMHLERFPSGKFAANSLILTLAAMAYNILRIIGQETIKIGLAPTRKKVARRRIRTVIQDIIYMACQVVKHSRRIKLKFSRFSAWFPSWNRVYQKFAST